MNQLYIRSILNLNNEYNRVSGGRLSAYYIYSSTLSLQPAVFTRDTKLNSHDNITTNKIVYIDAPSYLRISSFLRYEWKIEDHRFDEIPRIFREQSLPVQGSSFSLFSQIA